MNLQVFMFCTYLFDVRSVVEECCWAITQLRHGLVSLCQP